MDDTFKNYLDNFLVENNLTKNDEIDWILEVIDDLLKSGSIQNGVGYCLAMADLLQKLLNYNGIESELVECSLLIIDSNLSPPSITMVGYENATKVASSAMQNHVVLITKTKVPLLIDLSLCEKVKNVPYVIGTIDEDNHIQFASIKINNALFKYSRKPVSSIPYLHQQSILKRIELDSKIDSNFKNIQRLILILFIICTSNFIRGSYDFYQKYINETNGFGPNKGLDINKKI